MCITEFHSVFVGLITKTKIQQFYYTQYELDVLSTRKAILDCILLKHLLNKTVFLFPADKGNKPSVSEVSRMMDFIDVWTPTSFNDAIST